MMERRVRCRMKTTRDQTFSGRREKAGMPENCHWTEVGRLYLYIYIYMYALCSLGWLAKRVAPVPNRLII